MATWSLRLRPVWSLAPAAPASSVTRRSTAVWMSSSEGTNANEPSASSRSTVVEGGEDVGHLVVVEDPGPAQPPDVGPRAGDVVGGQAPVERQADREGHQLLGRSALEAAVPEGAHDRLVTPPPGPAGWLRPPRGGLLGRPGLDAEAPQPHEALGVRVAEAVGGVVGGQAVVVEAVRAAPTDHVAPARFEAQPHLAGDEALALVDEGVEGLLQRREPQAVVDELGVAALEALLLAGEVALEGDRLEVVVGHR